MREFGIESLSSSQPPVDRRRSTAGQRVSRAAELLDDELEVWRGREFGEIRYLMLDARLTRR